MDDRIYSEWLSDKPHSFGGKYRSYAEYKNLKKEVIDENFASNDIYTRFKQFRRAKFHNPVFVYAKRAQWQADVCYFKDPAMINATGGFKFLLVVIDIFTKYIWVYPLKQTTGAEIARCFTELFTNEKPKKITTDAGSEFLNRDVNLMCYHTVRFCDRKWIVVP